MSGTIQNPDIDQVTLHCLPYRNITAYITYTKVTDYQNYFEGLPNIEFKYKLQIRGIIVFWLYLFLIFIHLVT